MYGRVPSSAAAAAASPRNETMCVCCPQLSTGFDCPLPNCPSLMQTCHAAACTAPLPSGNTKSCPHSCSGTFPNCLCQLSPDGSSAFATLTTGAASDNGGSIVMAVNFGLPSSAAQAGAPSDCSQVQGCNKANCLECISLYWTHNPTTCLAGCTNAATALLPQPAGATECCGEVAALKEANGAKDAEIAAKDAENEAKDAEIAALKEANEALKEANEAKDAEIAALRAALQ